MLEGRFPTGATGASLLGLGTGDKPTFLGLAVGTSVGTVDDNELWLSRDGSPILKIDPDNSGNPTITATAGYFIFNSFDDMILQRGPLASPTQDIQFRATDFSPTVTSISLGTISSPWDDLFLGGDIDCAGFMNLGAVSLAATAGELACAGDVTIGTGTSPYARLHVFKDGETSGMSGIAGRGIAVTAPSGECALYLENRTSVDAEKVFVLNNFTDTGVGKFGIQSAAVGVGGISTIVEFHHTGDAGTPGLANFKYGVEIDGDLDHDGSNVGFYGVTPTGRATTGIAEATFVENSGGTVINVDSTFDGYTVQQIAEALQLIGILT